MIKELRTIMFGEWVEYEGQPHINFGPCKNHIGNHNLFRVDTSQWRCYPDDLEVRVLANIKITYEDGE